MPHHLFGPLLAAFASSLVFAVPAHAVTVQIEGTSVVQPPASFAPAAVTRGGETCPANSFVAALDAAVGGDWTGNSTADGATFDSPTSPGIVKSERHLFGSGGYWAVYVNGKFDNGTPCTAVAQPGDEVLWFASDDPFADGQSGYGEPLYMTGAPAIVKPGQAFTVDVREATTSFNPNPPYEGVTTHDPATGATVAGVTVGSDGKATVTLTTRGAQQIVVTKGTRVPDRASVCVTDGNDGFCGTELAKQAEQQQAAAACVTRGDDGLCGTTDKRPSYGFITSLSEQQRFAKGKGPRELKGRVDADPSGVKSVRLRITRRRGSRCTTFDASKQAFVKASCGAAKGKWFSVGDKADWTYLLPAALTRGRYVLDVEATDGAGNADSTLARGRNRVVFHVA